MPDTREAGREGATGAAIAACLYAVVAFFMLLQQPGATTYDTRAELTERPGGFLSGAFTLWHPESNFGEFQNQAYGYLFPQGTWFWLTDAVGMPGWFSQRLWSALLVIVACEELVWRGWVQAELREALGARRAWICCAASASSR